MNKMNHAENLKICILLSTYNGMPYLIEQISTIIHQSNVDLDVYVNDDYSTDGTYEYLKECVSTYSNFFLLERGDRHGSAGKNFYSLLEQVDFHKYACVAFADQDDIWNLDKLQVGIEYLWGRGNVIGVSSCVEAFWPDGRKIFVNKSGAQKSYDYFFEAAGPGCTYLFKSELANELKDLIRSNALVYHHVFHHDWLVYAYARSRGYEWHIFPFSTLGYRQHLKNETGVNSGLKAFKARLNKLKSGWYLDQVYSIAEVINSQEMLEKFFPTRGKASMHFYRNILEMRRRVQDALVLGIFLFLKFVR